MTARVFAVVGPSGAGKDTLIAGAQAAGAGFHWARRTITRPASAGGEPFEGVDRAEFDRRRAAGDFALWWDAHGLGYGIAWGEFAPLDAGRDVVFNGSRAALGQAAEVFPCLHVLHVTAPEAVLAKRLAGRGRETARRIAARLKRSGAAVPDGLPETRICNAGAVDDGVARFLGAMGAARG